MKITDMLLVGDEAQSPVVVAELGINHNGFYEQVEKLILAAKAAGAWAVKLQKRTVPVVYSREELAKPRLIPPENGILRNAVLSRKVIPPDAADRLIKSDFEKTTNGDLKWALEFTEAEYRAIAQFCRFHSIVFFASPWDEESVDLLERVGVPCHKVASACLTDEGLLSRLRRTGKPVILATGMSTMDEIHRAVGLLNRRQLVLLHSVSTYPSHDDELNLRMITTLRETFPDLPIGYSGHEKGIIPSLMARVLGAVMIERHLTLDRTLWGSDHAASLEPSELKMLVEQLAIVDTSLGDGLKRVLPREEEVMKKLRRKNFSPVNL